MNFFITLDESKLDDTLANSIHRELSLLSLTKQVTKVKDYEYITYSGNNVHLPQVVEYMLDEILPIESFMSVYITNSDLIYATGKLFNQLLYAPTIAFFNHEWFIVEDERIFQTNYKESYNDYHS